MPGLDVIQEAGRQLVICNACRYCEGYCPVFRAIETRRDFKPGDVFYLSNLCHDCRACYYACMFTPPHEFAINIPQILAESRMETYRRWSWPAISRARFQKSRRDHLFGHRHGSARRRSRAAVHFFGKFVRRSCRSRRVLRSRAIPRDGGGRANSVLLRNRRMVARRRALLVGNPRPAERTRRLEIAGRGCGSGARIAISKGRRSRMLLSGRAAFPGSPHLSLAHVLGIRRGFCFHDIGIRVPGYFPYPSALFAHQRARDFWQPGRRGAHPRNGRPDLLQIAKRSPARGAGRFWYGLCFSGHARPHGADRNADADSCAAHRQWEAFWCCTWRASRPCSFPRPTENSCMPFIELSP